MRSRLGLSKSETGFDCFQLTRDLEHGELMSIVSGSFVRSLAVRKSLWQRVGSSLAGSSENRLVWFCGGHSFCVGSKGTSKGKLSFCEFPI